MNTQRKLNTMKRKDVLLVLSYSNYNEYELQDRMREVETRINAELVRASIYDTEVVDELQKERWVIETILNTL
jgi:cell division protein FtsL